MRPLSTVEKPAFRKIIHGFNRNVHIPCHKTVGKRLNTRLQKMHDIVKSALSKASFVCMTADIGRLIEKVT